MFGPFRGNTNRGYIPFGQKCNTAMIPLRLHDTFIDLGRRSSLPSPRGWEAISPWSLEQVTWGSPRTVPGAPWDRLHRLNNTWEQSSYRPPLRGSSYSSLTDLEGSNAFDHDAHETEKDKEALDLIPGLTSEARIISRPPTPRQPALPPTGSTSSPGEASSWSTICSHNRTWSQPDPRLGWPSRTPVSGSSGLLMIAQGCGIDKTAPQPEEESTVGGPQEEVLCRDPGGEVLSKQRKVAGTLVPRLEEPRGLPGQEGLGGGGLRRHQARASYQTEEVTWITESGIKLTLRASIGPPY